MLKIADNGKIKQVYSDCTGFRGRAEISAFYVEYVETKNPRAWLDWIRHEKVRDMYYFEIEGKYYDTVSEDDIKKFNVEVLQCK